MRVIRRIALLVPSCVGTLYLGAQRYPPVRSLHRVFSVPDVRGANVSLDIASTHGIPLYRLQCHSAGYTGDTDFDYSGDFECRLNSIGPHDAYSTLLTEDVHQSRDWESRGRFFAANLRTACARIPQFGADRSFKLRGMTLTLGISDPVFTDSGTLHSLILTVMVDPTPRARRRIAEIVPLPHAGIPPACRLRDYFVDPADFPKP